LFALYVDDLANNLRFSSYGLHVGSLFVGCIFYANDIVLLSPSCFGLQKLLNICEQFAPNWDIKFNPDKSQLITFGGRNPYSSKLSINGSPLMWVYQVKYFGTYIYSFSQRSDLSCNIRKFQQQFNNKYPHEMATLHYITLHLHLVKSYCLPTLLYGCETWCVCERELQQSQCCLQ